jgi:hypothetical protein
MGNCHPTDSDFNENWYKCFGLKRPNFKFWLDRADTFRDMAPRNFWPKQAWPPTFRPHYLSNQYLHDFGVAG